VKNVFKFSYKLVSIPVNGFMIDTPGNSLRLLCDGFRWNLYRLKSNHFSFNDINFIFRFTTFFHLFNPLFTFCLFV
jgi:hypothetical protein